MQQPSAARLSEFRIFEAAEFRKVFDKLGPPPSVRNKIDSFVYPQLREMPFFGPNIKRLVGYDPPQWRYRIGAYRVFYSVDHDKRIVHILTIDHRKDAYR